MICTMRKDDFNTHEGGKIVRFMFAVAQCRVSFSIAQIAREIGGQVGRMHLLSVPRVGDVAAANVGEARLFEPALVLLLCWEAIEGFSEHTDEERLGLQRTCEKHSASVRCYEMRAYAAIISRVKH
eukprot:4285699-Pleurochrysis_carterae.AAC.3